MIETLARTKIQTVRDDRKWEAVWLWHGCSEVEWWVEWPDMK